MFFLNLIFDSFTLVTENVLTPFITLFSILFALVTQSCICCLNPALENPQEGKTIGVLVANILKQIKLCNQISTPKIENQRSDLVDSTSYIVPVLNGILKIGHRPGGSLSYPNLKRMGINTVLSLQCEKEKVLDIKTSAQLHDMDWLWIDLPNAQIPHEDMKPKITMVFESVKQKLENGEGVYIHCAAGMHRTGMITNAFLRFIGFTKESAYETLKKLRPLTAAAVLAHRLEYGEKFAK